MLARLHQVHAEYIHKTVGSTTAYYRRLVGGDSLPLCGLKRTVCSMHWQSASAPNSTTLPADTDKSLERPGPRRRWRATASDVQIN